MDWLNRLLGIEPRSAQVAKDRLKMVLSYDRANFNPQMLESLKDDIVQAISKRMQIDRANITIRTERGDNGEHLIADIPLRAVQAMRGESDYPAEVERGVRPPPPPSYRRGDYPAKRKKKR